MPVITLENAGSLSSEQKISLMEKLTAAVVEVTGKPAGSVYIRIDEVSRDNFGVGGRPLSERD